MPIEKGKKITEYITKIGRVAQTSHYQVNFSGLKPDLMDYLNKKGVDKNFITREVGIRCSSASLPGSSLATLNIDGNYMGVQERMAHSRIYTQMDLEFYVDRDYKMIRFFDCWMDYIAGGKSLRDKRQDNYYYRMTYPRGVEGKGGYKCDTIDIYKFERDQGPELQYTFYGMFPVNLSSLPVQYGNSDTLKMNVTFSYERYYKRMTGTKVNTTESSTLTNYLTRDPDPNALNRPTLLEESNSSSNNDMFERDGVPSKY
jgi:hypothetical protein